MLLECPQCRSDVRWSSVLSHCQTPRLQLVPDPDCTKPDSSAAAAALFTFLQFLSFKFELWWQQVCLCKSLWFTNRGMKSITEQQMCVCVCVWDRRCWHQHWLITLTSAERGWHGFSEFGGGVVIVCVLVLLHYIRLLVTNCHVWLTCRPDVIKLWFVGAFVNVMRSPKAQWDLHKCIWNPHKCWAVNVYLKLEANLCICSQ